MENKEVIQEVEEEEDEIDQEEELFQYYYEKIDAVNIANFLKTAIQMKNDKEFEEAALIFKALINKGSQIYNSELNINLADIYYQLGNCLLEQIELIPDDLLGDPEIFKKKREEFQKKYDQLNHDGEQEGVVEGELDPNQEINKDDITKMIMNQFMEKMGGDLDQQIIENLGDKENQIPQNPEPETEQDQKQDEDPEVGGQGEEEVNDGL